MSYFYRLLVATALLLPLSALAQDASESPMAIAQEPSEPEVSEDAPSPSLTLEDVERPSTSVDAGQIFIATSSPGSDDRVIDQITIETTEPEYSILQAEGGEDRCDPQAANPRDCSDLQTRILPGTTDQARSRPEIELVESVEFTRDPSRIDPLDAIDKIARGRPEGSQAAQALGQDLLDSLDDAPVERDITVPDGLDNLPEDVLINQGLLDVVITQAQ